MKIGASFALLSVFKRDESKIANIKVTCAGHRTTTASGNARGNQQPIIARTSFGRDNTC